MSDFIDVHDIAIRNRIATDGRINVTVEDWNNLLTHIDRLEQENAELKKALSIVHQMCSAMTGPAYSKLPIHNHVKKLLNK